MGKKRTWRLWDLPLRKPPKKPKPQPRPEPPPKPPDGYLRCEKCQRVKPDKDFPTEKRTRRKQQPTYWKYCKKCENRRARERRKRRVLRRMSDLDLRGQLEIMRERIAWLEEEQRRRDRIRELDEDWDDEIAD